MLDISNIGEGIRLQHVCQCSLRFLSSNEAGDEVLICDDNSSTLVKCPHALDGHGILTCLREFAAHNNESCLSIHGQLIYLFKAIKVCNGQSSQNYQLSFNYQVSSINYQVSIINYYVFV